MTGVRLTKLQAIVLATIASFEGGATADQVQPAARLSHQNASSRCSELLKMGAVIRKPRSEPDKQGRLYERRRTAFGRNAAILIVNPEASRRLKRRFSRSLPNTRKA